MIGCDLIYVTTQATWISTEVTTQGAIQVAIWVATETQTGTCVGAVTMLSDIRLSLLLDAAADLAADRRGRRISVDLAGRWTLDQTGPDERARNGARTTQLLGGRSGDLFQQVAATGVRSEVSMGWKKKQWKEIGMRWKEMERVLEKLSLGEALLESLKWLHFFEPKMRNQLVRQIGKASGGLRLELRKERKKFKIRWL